MKVLEHGKFKGEFDITCFSCGCKYSVIGPYDFIFSDELDDDTLYSDSEFVATTHNASTKCPECLYVQKYSD